MTAASWGTRRALAKTHVAVFQPSISGIRLTPRADFSSLRFVRKGPPPPAS